MICFEICKVENRDIFIKDRCCYFHFKAYFLEFKQKHPGETAQKPVYLDIAFYPKRKYVS